MWSNCRTDTPTRSSTGPERRQSLRLQGELQLCDVQWPAHTQRRPSVWAALPGAPFKAGSWRPPHPLLPWRSVLCKSVYAAISCFTSKREDKQGVATDSLLTGRWWGTLLTVLFKPRPSCISLKSQIKVTESVFFKSFMFETKPLTMDGSQLTSGHVCALLKSGLLVLQMFALASTYSRWWRVSGRASRWSEVNRWRSFRSKTNCLHPKRSTSSPTRSWESVSTHIKMIAPISKVWITCVWRRLSLSSNWGVFKRVWASTSPGLVLCRAWSL